LDEGYACTTTGRSIAALKAVEFVVAKAWQARMN
jgi:hypothetical protein